MILALLACTDINQDDLLIPREDDTGAATDSGLPDGDERLLLLNGKLSSKEANYTLNARDGDGDWIGSSLYVWDPASPGALERLGWLWYGPDDGEHDWETMTVREVAVDASGAVWVVLIDQGTDDEWLIARLDVPDPDGRDQELAVTPWAVNPGDADLYAATDLTGAAVDGDGRLLLGTPAEGAFPGALHAFGPLPPEDAGDGYYAAAGGATALGALPDNLGIAGDLVGHDGRRLALVRPGNDFTICWLYDVDAGEVIGEGTARDADQPLTGLASVNGALVAAGIEGDLFRVDPATGAFTALDDVGPALPPDDLGQATRRLRGAATLGAP